MWFNGSKRPKKPPGSQSDDLQEERNCMNVPSNVKWRIFYMRLFFSCVHFSVLLFFVFCFFFLLLLTLFWKAQKKLKPSVQAGRVCSSSQWWARRKTIRTCDTRCISAPEMHSFLFSLPFHLLRIWHINVDTHEIIPL